MEFYKYIKTNLYKVFKKFYSNCKAFKFYIKLCEILKSNYNKYHIFRTIKSFSLSCFYTIRHSTIGIVDKSFFALFPTIYSSMFHQSF